MDLKETRSSTLITIWLFISLLGSSLEPVLVKYFNLGITPLALMCIKSICGFILILPFLTNLKSLDSNLIKPLLLVSGLAFLTNVLIFAALEKIPASVLITIITTTPAFVGFVNAKRGTVEISSKFILALLIVILGVTLTLNSMTSNLESWNALGLLLAFTSVITSVCYRIKMDELTQKVRPITISAFLFMATGISSLFILPFVHVSSTAWSLGAWLGFAGVVANIAFLYAIKHLGSTRVSVLSIIQRPMAVILGVIVLEEIVTIVQIIGMCLVFIGIYHAKARKVEPSLTFQKNSKEIS